MQFLYYLLLSNTSNAYVNPEIRQEIECFTFTIKFNDGQEKKYDAQEILSEFEIFSEDFDFFKANKLKGDFFSLEYKLNTTLHIFEGLLGHITSEQLESNEYLEAYNYLQPLRISLPKEFDKISGRKSKEFVKRKVVYSPKGTNHLLIFFLRKLNIKTNSFGLFIAIGEFDLSLLKKRNENQPTLYMKLKYLKEILSYEYIQDTSDDIYLKLFNFINDEDSKFSLKIIFADFLNTLGIGNIFIFPESKSELAFLNSEIFKDLRDLLIKKRKKIIISKICVQ